MERYAPPPIAPPKGLTGTLKGHQYDPNEVLDTSNWSESMVILNVYDVSDGELFQRINKVTTANNNILVGGVFHAGVEIYGKEWCYGVTEYGRSGVAAVHPRTHPQHTYKCSVPYRATDFTAQEVETLLVRLSQEWPGHEYDLLHHNCVSFCNALLHELVAGRVPGWVDRFMKTAAAIDHTSRKVKEDTRQTIELVRSFTSDLEQKARNLTGDDAANQAADALEVVKISSAKALDVARSESAKLAELAQAQAKDISDKAPDFLNAFGSSFNGLFKSTELSDDLGEKAEVFRQKTQEQVQALGSSLWQWGQDLQKGMAGQNPAATSSAEGLDDAGTSRMPEQKPTTKGLLDEDDDDLLSGPANYYGTEGMVRKVEESILSQGLLDDDDEEDAVQVAARNLRGGGSAGKLEEVEAPEDWLSSAARAPVTAAPAAPPPVIDLLTGDDDL